MLKCCGLLPCFESSFFYICLYHSVIELKRHVLLIYMYVWMDFSKLKQRLRKINDLHNPGPQTLYKRD